MGAVLGWGGGRRVSVARWARPSTVGPADAVVVRGGSREVRAWVVRCSASARCTGRGAVGAVSCGAVCSVRCSVQCSACGVGGAVRCGGCSGCGGAMKWVAVERGPVGSVTSSSAGEGAASVSRETDELRKPRNGIPEANSRSDRVVREESHSIANAHDVRNTHVPACERRLGRAVVVLGGQRQAGVDARAVRLHRRAHVFAGSTGRVPVGSRQVTEGSAGGWDDERRWRGRV